MTLTFADLRAIPPRWWRQMFRRCALLLLLFGIVVPPPQVSAAGIGGSVGVCAAGVDAGNAEWTIDRTSVLTGEGQDALERFADACLPGRRWLEGFSVLHGRFDADAWNDLPSKTGQGAAGTVLSFAQLLNGARSNIMSWALYSKSVFISSTVTVDRVWAKVGDALWDSGVFTIAILFAVASAAWKWAFRNKMMSLRSVSKDIVVALLVFWAFAGLLGEARRSAEAQGNTPLNCFYDDWDRYRCESWAGMSPGSLTRDFVNGIDSLAAAPAAALADAMGNDGAGAGGIDDLPPPWGTDPINCTDVVAAMRATFAEVAAQRIGTSDSIEPVALLVDDRLTMETLGRTWELAQGGGSPAFERVACVLLEWNSQTRSPAEMAAFFKTFGNGWDDLGGGEGDGADNPFNLRANQELDRRFVAWMACSVDAAGNPAVVTPWGSQSGRGKIDVTADAQCGPFVTSGDDGGDEGWADYEEDGAGNDVGPNTDPLLLNTTESWQGHRPGMTLGAALIAVLTALILLIVNAFGALGCIVAMLTIVVGVPVAGPIVLAIAAFPGRTSIVRKFGRRIGFAACARALFVLQLSMLAAVGQMVLELWPGPSGQWGVLWRGLVWVGAAMVVHTAAKMSKTPSVLTPSGAFAWGAGSAVGGAMVASRVQRGARAPGRMLDARRNRMLTKQRFNERIKGKTARGDGGATGPGSIDRRGQGQGQGVVDAGDQQGRRRGKFASKAGLAATTLRERGQRILQGEEGSRRRANWTDRQAERGRRRALDGQRREELQARRQAARTERTEQRRALSDAKWSRRRERISGALDTVADEVTGRSERPDHQATVEARRAARAAAAAEVNAARSSYRRGNVQRRQEVRRGAVPGVRNVGRRSRWSRDGAPAVAPLDVAKVRDTARYSLEERYAEGSWF